MSERKNLKWICRRCAKVQFAKPEVSMVIEKDTELEKECSFCGTKTWCFLVASSRLVESKTASEVTADDESTEDIEALEEVAEEALEEILEVIERDTESPEETAPAEGLEPTEEEAVAPSPEEEAEAIKETLDILQDESYDDLLPAKIDKNTEIARLEAELEKLRPVKK